MIKDEYSPYKFIHHPKHIEMMRSGEHVSPIQVQLVPTNRCNHNCIQCAYHIDGMPSNQQFTLRDEIHYDKLIEIVNDCKDMGVQGIQLTGGGEPTIHPQITQLMEYITHDGLIKLSLVTNAERLSDDMIDILVKHGSWVRISLDAGTKETHSKYRQVSKKSFYKVIGNIERLVKHRDDENSDLVIGVGFVVNDCNYKEIYTAGELARNIGVDNFRISGAFTPTGFDYFAPFYKEASDIARETSRLLSSDKFTVFNLFDDRVKDTQDTQDYDHCPIKDIQAYIGADYNVYTCCTLAYNKRGLVGSIKERSFKDLWYSKETMSMFKNHNPRKMCNLMCMYKGKNEFINYCIKDNPVHKEFI